MVLRVGWNTRKMVSAVGTKDWDTVISTLQEGAEATAEDSLVLRAAVNQNRTDVALLALEKGANPFANGGEAVNKAVSNGNLEVFDALLSHDTRLVFNITLAVLAQARYLSAHTDIIPGEFMERMAEIVRRVDDVAEKFAAQSVAKFRDAFKDLVSPTETAAPAAPQQTPAALAM